MNKPARIDWLFIALLMAQIALFWSVHFIPSQDGTSHLANAHVLLKYFSADGGAYRQYYAINQSLEPNLLSHALLVALMSMAPAVVAQKILISGYVIALALGARYAIRTVSPRNDFLAVLIFPLAGNLMLQKGFYNFSYSLAAYLWFVGYWLRGRRSPGKILGLSLLLYLCHPVSLILALATAGASSIVEMVQNRGGVRRQTMAWLALIPAMALMAYFFIAQTRVAGPIGGEIHAATLSGKWIVEHLQMLLALDVLFSYRPYEEVWLARGYAVMVGVMLILGLIFSPSVYTPSDAQRRTLTLTLSLGTGRGDKSAMWLALVIAVVAFFFAPNESAGGSLISLRLSLYPWLLLLLILAGLEYGPAARCVIRAAAAILAMGMIGSHALAYRAAQASLADYVSAASHIDRGSTIVSAISDQQSRHPPRVRCMLTATGYLDEERGLIDLYNYEALMGYFPLVYRPELNPGPYFDDSKDDIAGYLAATHGRVDYVLIWQAAEKSPPRAMPMLQPVLDADYRLVYTSPSGSLFLYRRK